MCYRNFGLYINVSLIILGAVMFSTYMISIYKNYEKLYKFTIVLLYCALIVVGIMTAIVKSGILEQLDSIDGMVAYIRSIDSQFTVLIYIFIEFIQVTFVPISSSIVTGAGAILFETRLEAILYSCIGLWVGSIVAFFIGRIFGINAVKWIAGEASLTKYYEMLNGKDKLMLFYMFILPVFPDDLLCMIAGLTSMSFPMFLAMQLISRPLNVAMTVYMVEIFKIVPLEGWGIAVWIAIAVVIIALMIAFWKFSPLFEKNLINFINYLSRRNVITYRKTNVEHYHRENFALESRVYKSDPYDDDSKLKKEVRIVLGQEEKKYKSVEDIIDSDGPIGIKY